MVWRMLSLLCHTLHIHLVSCPPPTLECCLHPAAAAGCCYCCCCCWQDVEGFELQVLQGAESLLAKCNVNYVVAECTFGGEPRQRQMLK